MNNRAIDQGLRAASLLWTGVMAGFFFAFSSAVMPGLDDSDPLAAMEAMQAINDAVINAVFAIAFFGAPLICLVTMVRSLRRGGLASWLVVVGCAIYLVGVFGVTVGFNVPLNEELARRNLAQADAAPAMVDYIATWSTWNDVRTLSGLAAFALLALSQFFENGGEVSRGSTA